MEHVQPPTPETDSLKKAENCKLYLFLLAISFLAGATLIIVFMESRPASPRLDIIAFLLAAYALGLFSSFRLLRSGSSVFRVIGLLGLLIQSLVMLAFCLLLARVT